MELFWERGYEATSLQDLTDALEIGRGSLYAAFGSKDGLFQAALARYRQEQAQPLLDALASDADIRTALRQLLGGVVAKAVADERRRGCLVVNSATERNPARRRHRGGGPPGAGVDPGGDRGCPAPRAAARRARPARSRELSRASS